MVEAAQGIHQIKALISAGDIDQAESHCHDILASSPHQIDAHFLIGVIAMRKSQYERAKQHFETCIRIRPKFAEAHNNLGIILAKWKHPIAAMRHFELALQNRAGFVNAAVNRARLLQETCRVSEAIDQLQEMLQSEPNDPNLHVEIGYAYMRDGDFESGRSHYVRACELDENCAEAHWNLAMCLLTLGDFENGWREYEWRWKCAMYSSFAPVYDLPRWNGSPILGKTVLLHAEQGLGDTLQFIRYGKVLKDMGATTIFHCPKNWTRLFSRIEGLDEIHQIGVPLPKCDAHASIMSLPHVFQTKLDTIPQSIPYATAEPARIEYWREFLGRDSSLRVGIAWKGSGQYQYDQQRSIPLTVFEPISQIPNVRLISLQKGEGTEQIYEAAKRFSVIDLGDKFDNDGDAFVDTAAVMKNLDLVITCDTAIGHLAGAMGVPVWLGLAKVADWRWLLDRNTTPWYPNMRLFRQSSMGDWLTVMNQMAMELPRCFDRNEKNDASFKYD